jgi:hypothetical protein
MAQVSIQTSEDTSRILLRRLSCAPEITASALRVSMERPANGSSTRSKYSSWRPLCLLCTHTGQIARRVAIVEATTDGEYSSITCKDGSSNTHPVVVLNQIGSDGHVSRYPNYTLHIAASKYKTRATMRWGFKE